MAHAGVSSKPARSNSERDFPPAPVLAILHAHSVLARTTRSEDSAGLALDWVELVVRHMEDSGRTNAGVGAVRQADGVARRDASVQRGDTLACGAASSLRNARNPVSVARAVMEKTRHCHLAHDFAEARAKEWGLSFLGEGGATTGPARVTDEGDTVGATCCAFGGLAAATSTGGLAGSDPGRVGDSCVIGAGTYANERAAASLTGRGEDVVKLCGAKRVVDLVAHHRHSPAAATRKFVAEFSSRFDSVVGAICVDAKGRWGVAFRGARMNWCAARFSSSRGAGGQFVLKPIELVRGSKKREKIAFPFPSDD
ncbi:MAG: hypothetical protein Kow0069_06680 [Promethearchaeota archaeon]